MRRLGRIMIAKQEPVDLFKGAILSRETLQNRSDFQLRFHVDVIIMRCGDAIPQHHAILTTSSRRNRTTCVCSGSVKRIGQPRGDEP